MDGKFAVVGYRHFRKDGAISIKGGTDGVSTVINDTIPAVHHTIADIPVNDVVASTIDPPESRLTFICVYCPPGRYPQTDTPLLAQLNTHFGSPIRLVLVSDLNFGHINWGTKMCHSCVRLPCNSMLEPLLDTDRMPHLPSSMSLPGKMTQTSPVSNFTTHLSSAITQLSNAKSMGDCVLPNQTQ